MPDKTVRSPRGWRIAALAAGLLLAVAACSGHSPANKPESASQHPTTTRTLRPQAATPSSVAPPAPCRQWGCRPHQTVQLASGYAARLWLATNQQDYRSRPVVELLLHGKHAQWWTSPQGDGWNGSLTCATSGPEVNCDLLDSDGMHAGVAEMLILREGHLVHPPAAQVTTDSGQERAADLDGDGYLDVFGVTNDYRPNYAQGHNYWQTFRYTGDRLVSTGCELRAPATPAPTRLLTGACPAQ